MAQQDLEKKAALERSFLREALNKYSQERKRLDLVIGTLEMSINQLETNPEHYFTIKAEIKAYFEEEIERKLKEIERLKLLVHLARKNKVELVDQTKKS